MKYTLRLPDEWASQGWKAKIRGDERTEEPHVTLLRRVWGWRVSLRTGAFLDREPDPRGVPAALAAEVWARRAELRRAWDAKYPENPVFSTEE